MKQISNNKKELTRMKHLGMEYTTNQGYTIKVINVFDSHNVVIEFVNVWHPYTTSTTLRNIQRGEVMYPFHKNEYGGYYGNGPYTARYNGEKTEAYRRWFGLLIRCNGKGNDGSSYKDVTICDEWYNFQNFAEWYYSNKPNIDYISWDIDKDFLSVLYNTNKEYSPEKCIFIPDRLNSEIVNMKNRTKSYLIDKVKKYKSVLDKNTYKLIIKSIKQCNLPD